MDRIAAVPPPREWPVHTCIGIVIVHSLTSFHSQRKTLESRHFDLVILSIICASKEKVYLLLYFYGLDTYLSYQTLPEETCLSQPPSYD